MKQRRKYFVFVCAIIAFCGSVVAVFASLEQRNFMLRGYVDPTRNAELPFWVPRFGVNAELLQYDNTTLSYQLNLMQQAHIVWIRQFVYWDEIEPIEGRFNWDQWDNLIATLQNFPEFELVVVIAHSPSWARSSIDNHNAPPDSPSTLARFAGEFAARYGSTVDYYQIWDEPNLQSGWGDVPPNAAEYAAMLAEVYKAIHAADPGSSVLAAALAPTIELGPNNISDLEYLRDLYAYGLQDFSEAVAAKPYGFYESPEDRLVRPEHLNFSRIIALREIMVEYGDKTTPLWASNWGWNSLPDDWEGSSSIWGQVNPDEQIRYTLGALERAQREWPWLGGMILYHWQPDVPPQDPKWGFAVIDQSDSPGVLWAALRDRVIYTSALDGLYAAQNPYAKYSGIWTLSSFGADVGWVNDSQVTFDFHGSDVALLVRQDDYVAYLYPEISDSEINALPNDINGNPYILLTSETLRPELTLVPIARHLDKRNHQLRVIADELVPDELVNRWHLVGFAVSSGNLRQPYDRQIIVAIVTTMIATAALFLTASQVAWYPLRRRFAHLWGVLGFTGQIILSGVTSVALLLGMYLTYGDGVPTLFRRDSVQIGLSVLTSGLIYINEPSIVLTLASACMLFVLVFNRLELGLVLIIFWSPFFLFPVELHRFAFPIAEIILGITVAAFTLQVVASFRSQPEGLRLRLLPLDYMVISWVMLGCMSLIWAEHRSVALTELRSLIVQPALFYLMYRLIPVKRHTVLLLVDALIAAGLAVALVGLYMWATKQGVITAEEGVRRLASVYGSPNNVGLLLGRCLPFLLAFMVVFTDRLRQRLAVIGVLVVVIALTLTQSAGALFLAVPVGTGAVIVFRWRKWSVLPLITLGIAFVLAVAFAVQSPRFARLLDLTEGTNFYRLRVWQSAINMIEDHPFTGIGLDQFLYKFRGEYIMPDAWEEPNLSHPHNFILDFWLRLGFLGVFLFFVIQTRFWRMCLRIYDSIHRTDRNVEIALVIGLMGSMGSLLAHGMVDNSVHVLDLSYIFVLLLGSAAALQNIRAIDA